MDYGIRAPAARLLAALALGALAAASPGTAQVPLSRDQAIEIVLDQVISDEEYARGFIAYAFTRPLASGEAIGPDDFSGRSYQRPESWFFYLDDNPEAVYGHPVRYVFVDRLSGRVEAIDEQWWPALGGRSIFDLEAAGALDLTRIYPAGRAALSTGGEASDAPEADYGDAPDDTAADLPPGSGRFPTVRRTANSLLSRPGAHALETGLERLGDGVSRERDATDPADPDGRPNLVDADADDRTYLLLDRAGADAVARLAFHVTVDAAAPEVARWINAAADLDLDLAWREGTGGREWVVENLRVDVPPGSLRFVFTGSFRLGRANAPPSGFWTRIVLSREPIDAALFAGLGGWDGSGAFRFGEVEDSIFYLRLPPRRVQPPPPPPPPPEPPPKRDAWGTPIVYKAIVVDGGDRRDQSIVREAADTMARALTAQGYDIVAQLGPGNTAAGDLSSRLRQAVADLRGQIQCVDRIFLFIVAHGSRDGYFVFYGRGGKERVDPVELDAILDQIPPCANEPCDMPEKNCRLEVFLESCYAGNFAGPLAAVGRNVVTSSAADEVSWSGSDGSGGELSDEVASAFGDAGADADGDGSVSFQEAFARARGRAVTPQPQTPAGSFQACPCLCPPKPHFTYKLYYKPGQKVRWKLPPEVWGELPPGVVWKLAEPGFSSHGMRATAMPPGLAWDGEGLVGKAGKAGEFLPLLRFLDPEGHVVAEVWWHILVGEGPRPRPGG